MNAVMFCIHLEYVCSASLWQVTSPLLEALFRVKLSYLVGEVLKVACGYF